MKKTIIFLIMFFSFNVVNALTDYAPNAKSAILIEQSTGTILYEKNSHEKLAPASLTKLMTLLLTMEAIESNKISYDDEVIISKNAADMGGSQIYIDFNTKISVHDLLKGTMIASANDAAYALAELVGGTEENFVNMMNNKAKFLGLKNTNFKNSHGLDETDHYMSAYDVALIAKELLNHKDILNISSIYEDYIEIDGESRWIVNTNKLVRFYSGMDGLKTGYTDAARHCLVSTMSKNGMRLVGVVMKEDNKEHRNSDSINMMEYGYSMYNVKTMVESKKSLGKIFISNTKKRYYDYYLEKDANVVVDINTTNVEYSYDINLYDVSLPINKNNIIGELIFKSKEKEIKYNLIVNEDIKKASFIQNYYNFFEDVLFGSKVIKDN